MPGDIPELRTPGRSAAVSGRDGAVPARGAAARAYLTLPRTGVSGLARDRRHKQHPDGAVVELPWPASVAGPCGRDPDAMSVVGAVAASYAPTRYHYFTGRSCAVLDGRPVAGGEGYPPVSGVARAVPSGGGFHPTELYAAVAGDDSLPGGLYHYDATHHLLETLATGDPRGLLRTALGHEPAGVVFLISCRLWKNSAKYGSFGYRLGVVDSGVLLGMVLAAVPAPVPAAVRFTFDTDLLDAAFGLDPDLESSYALVEAQVVGVRKVAGRPPPAVTRSTGLAADRELLRLAHPAVLRLHRASRAATGDARVLSGGTPPGVVAPLVPGVAAPSVVPPASGGTPPSVVPLPGPLPVDLRRGVAVRRSAVRLTPAPLSQAEFGTVLWHLLSGYDSDLAGTAGRCGHLSAYCAVERVEDVEPGGYAYDPYAHRLVSAGRRGDIRASVDAVRVEGNGSSLRPAAASIFLYGVLDAGLDAVGDAWYRIQGMIAGIAVQRAALAASATGLACRPSFGYHSGPAARLFGLPADQHDLMHVVVGRGAPLGGVVDIALGPGTPAGGAR
ncbi:hypothetical protein O7626_20060 [Micromonospora sp. WMMD1102]|uniref:nitroreductase family protein n=1 Tax=Micromonospora sp. WMMD1102 TaxID=3016105 RepID=UPI002415645B|nr:nitroreductase family protein [Micromonospora sp. WMMD1102]MDG4788205.1 hypothetical protein [Micromonospora sp. WMMD1102]